MDKCDIFKTVHHRLSGDFRATWLICLDKISGRNVLFFLGGEGGTLWLKRRIIQFLINYINLTLHLPALCFAQIQFHRRLIWVIHCRSSWCNLRTEALCWKGSDSIPPLFRTITVNPVSIISLSVINVRLRWRLFSAVHLQQVLGRMTVIVTIDHTLVFNPPPLH